MEKNQKLDQVLSELIRPLTFPVAIKILKERDQLPEKTKEAKKTTGHRVAFCQGVSQARRLGRKLVFGREDHACAVSMMIFGYEEETEMVKRGEIVYPYYAKNLEAGAITQEKTPSLPKESIHRIVVSPLAKADFEPDVVVVYGNAAQIIRLVQGALYNKGGSIESAFSGRGACGSYLAVPYLTKECKVIVPGGGERVFAHTADDELCFAMPKEKIDDVVEGLIATHKIGIARIPTTFAGMWGRPAFPDKYKELEKDFNMDD